MSWWKEYAERIESDVPLGRLTWFKLGGRAKCLFRPRDAEDLASFMARAGQEPASVRVLGAGANVLVRDDGFNGVVVRLDRTEFRRVEETGTAARVGAGVDLMPLCREMSRRGLGGLECMAGIPATMGGAVRMNAGGRFGNIGDVVRDVGLIDSDGQLRTWSHQQCGFGYRHSEIGRRIVVFATLDLVRSDPTETMRKFDEYFEFKRRTQPMADRSAGCIFKNPAGASAGALIDQAGLKGLRQGQAVVSQRHANFIVTHEGATSSDVLGLISTIKDRVRDAFDTELETEIDIW